MADTREPAVAEEAALASTTQKKTPVHLTHTQQRLLGYIAAQSIAGDGAHLSKKDLASMFHCSVKTIDRAITLLRRERIIEVEATYLENGGQLSNVYRIAQ